MRGNTLFRYKYVSRLRNQIQGYVICSCLTGNKRPVKSKPMRRTLIALIVLLSSTCCIAQSYSTVKINMPASKAERSSLIGLLELDHYQLTEDNNIIVEIGPREMLRLQQSGYKYQVLVADLQRKLEQENARYYEARSKGLPADETAGRLAFEQTGKTVDQIIATPTAFEVKSTFGGYYSFAEMNAAMNQLAADYPALVTKFSIGQSHLGNDIWCIKISDNPATDETSEPEVLFIGLQHAREAIGGSSMLFFMQYLCENYATNTAVRDLVNNREIFIIPCMNPDGWEYNRLNGGAGAGWRKNRRNNPGSDEGVDLNRNWGWDWGNCSAPIQGAASSCGSSSYSSDTYYGPSAFSEPETQAIRDFTYSHHLVAMIDQHAYGPYYSLPFGRPSLSTNVMDPLDDKYYTYISAAMGTYNGMRAGDSYQALDYEVAGGVKDWMLKGNIGTGNKGKVMGLTGEGGAGGGTGGSYGSFWPPASQIINLSKGIVFQNLQLLYAAGSYINLQDISDMRVTGLSGSFGFSATRVGLADAPVKVSLIPLENIASVGAPVTINSMPNYFDKQTATVGYTLPAALSNGQRIRYAWRIETGGVTYYDTVTKFYNPVTLLYDDMEGSFNDNWINNSTSGAWGLTAAGTGYGGGSSRALSESPSGKYGASTTRMAIYKQSFDLSDATASWLSFQVRHRAENFRDKLQIQISTNSTNGIDGAWTAVAGTTTVQEPGTLDGSTINGIPALTGVKEEWTRELFDLSAFTGHNAVWLRFVFTAGPTNSFYFSEDDGFYIDELSLIKSTAPLVTLPVHFTGFTAQLQPDATVRLQWWAQTDAQHAYFEVEKSADGSRFTSIGRGPSAAPYIFTDPSPYAGTGYYRIRQVDMDGSVTYSAVVLVNYQLKAAQVQLFPNPAAKQVEIRILTDRSGRYSLRITDYAGREVKQTTIWVTPGTASAGIDISTLAAQLYIVNLYDQLGRPVATRQLVVSR
jgi:murein tripeptide amidase MpaA